jgi:hypothetical protein
MSVRRATALSLAALLVSSVVLAQTPPPSPPTEVPAVEAPEEGEPSPASGAPAVAPAAEGPAAPSHGERMRAYHDAMARRRLAPADPIRLELLSERVAESEQLVAAGRHDEAIARLTETVEHPRFDVVAQTEPGRAALYLLGHALANAGIHESARAYLRQSLAQKGAWDQYGPYARRAVRRLVEIALESKRPQSGLADLAGVPSDAPEEVRGEIAYVTGRAREADGDVEGALAAYGRVPQTSRFWSQATYLSGLLHVERGRFAQGENLFCKVADPKRQGRTTPVFADERFFAVRDLARLALGRVAHEQLRHDDARYYYYLVPRDSDRLAEALYEAATTRYEKKDYEGARELTDELGRLAVHHRYEDEARILDAYIDLALCRFNEADAKMNAFLRRYEPLRDATRRLADNEGGRRALLASARTSAELGADGAASVSVSPEQLRAVAALLRVDPLYREIATKRAILEREASGLRLATGTLADMQRSLATTGGLRPAVVDQREPLEQRERARAGLDGVRRQLDDLELTKAPRDQITKLREELLALEGRLPRGPAPTGPAGDGAAGGGADLPELLRADASLAASLTRGLEAVRAELGAAEDALARDALKRLDLRLSRLLRRARLGRIESVLGKKRALEVEVEAILAGYLPKDAIDSLDAARYLKDSEEYWPFEGDDWPDEFVGSEGLR